MLFACYLEARLPEANLARAYHVVVSEDLFGQYTVDITFGRIGTHGTVKRCAVTEIGAVRAKLRQVLKRRLTAPRRLGVAYHCRSLFDPQGWLAEDGLELIAA